MREATTKKTISFLIDGKGVGGGLMFFSLFSGVPTQWTESDRQKSQTGTGASTDRSSGNGRWIRGEQAEDACYKKLRKRAFDTKKSFNSIF